MNFQQVALAVMAFSSARGGMIDQRTAHSIAVVPPVGFSRIIVEQDFKDADSWYVRVANRGGRRTLQPPVYFPAVTTQEGLQDALQKAWDFHRQTSPPAPFLTRFLEPPTSSPPRGASPPRLQTGTSRQTPPHLG
jgi:hypothetical protein